MPYNGHRRAYHCIVVVFSPGLWPVCLYPHCIGRRGNAPAECEFEKAICGAVSHPSCSFPLGKNDHPMQARCFIATEPSRLMDMTFEKTCLLWRWWVVRGCRAPDVTWIMYSVTPTSLPDTQHRTPVRPTPVSSSDSHPCRSHHSAHLLMLAASGTPHDRRATCRSAWICLYRGQ